MKTKRYLLNLIFWIILSILVNIIIYYFKGEKSAIEYFGGYIVEMSLSLDNLFLFLLIFSNFKIREEYQERVLLYGVIGAMILRLIFIILGVAAIRKFKFLLSLFGILLIYSGFNIFIRKDEGAKFHENLAVKILKNVLPITDTLHGNKFFVKQNKIVYATPLLVVLIIIEFSDIIFAIDSIPAIFSITTDTLVVYTSNIFAILGLRSMYYVLAKMNNIFRFMKFGVGAVLIFTGIKLFILMFKIEISVTNSILIILCILLSSILFSLIFDGTIKNKNMYH